MCCTKNVAYFSAVWLAGWVHAMYENAIYTVIIFIFTAPLQLKPTMIGSMAFWEFASLMELSVFMALKAQSL